MNSEFLYVFSDSFFTWKVLILIVIFKIGQVSAVLKTQGAQLIFPVALLHAAAFALGYWLSKISFGESTSRTISIECGMQVCICFVSIFVNL